MKIIQLFPKLSPHQGAVARPFIIAEAGVNHEGKMEFARRLIHEAAEGGADAIKFQTYRAVTIASKHSPSYWDLSKEPTRSQYDLFQKYDKFWKSEFEQIKIWCDEASIEFLSTPFDVESAIFLNDLMEVFKISSSDITNKPFIEFLCSFGKPLILSTGASHLWEIEEAVGWIERCDNPFALLHCVLNYPTADEDANLGMIASLREKFPGSPIGYSDHTLPSGMQVLEVATLLGAKILEKHFTFDKTLPGNDHYHAMDKEDLRCFHRRLDRIFDLLGSFRKAPLATEGPARENARRSLVAACAISAGRTITHKDLTWKRPAQGISPRDIDSVVGQIAARNISEDELLQWDMVCKKLK